jgi:hypothetical protein
LAAAAKNGRPFPFLVNRFVTQRLQGENEESAWGIQAVLAQMALQLGQRLLHHIFALRWEAGQLGRLASQKMTQFLPGAFVNGRPRLAAGMVYAFGVALPDLGVDGMDGRFGCSIRPHQFLPGQFLINKFRQYQRLNQFPLLGTEVLCYQVSAGGQIEGSGRHDMFFVLFASFRSERAIAEKQPMAIGFIQILAGLTAWPHSKGET